MHRRRPLYAWMAANAISFTGNRLTNLAIPWFVLETTGSVAQAGITGFFSLLPIVLATFFGGPIIERVGYKRVSIVSDILSGVTVALIPLLHATVGISFWQLQVLVFLGAFLDAPGSTARTAMVPELSQEGEVPLERANALTQVMERLAVMVGPLMGGVLIGTIGAANVLWVNAGTFLISSLLIGFGVPSRLVPRPQPSVEGYLAGYVRDLREGVQFVRRERLLFVMIAVITFSNFLESPTSSVLLPAYAEQILGSSTALGAIVSAHAAGSIIGASLYAAMGPRLSRRLVYLSAWLVAAVPQVAAAQLPPLPFMIGLAMLMGLGSGPLNPIIFTVMQERVPLQMRARVFGMVRSLAWMAMPLGPMIGGYAAEAIGLRGAYTIIAVTYLLVAIGQFFIREMHTMDTAPRPAMGRGGEGVPGRPSTANASIRVGTPEEPGRCITTVKRKV